ncbi:putative ABC transporter substrate binding protein [Gordonia araii NBRC 100433]|uniref:Putative ABC transporter substrate binding protein n=1 Tax=Gordonia araii NBRC 100433 TaxID=1073574 RepID=G7GY33_9ACTN|nr:glutamate ABC transporter substrate-binding protein [Gordonia araii]NNG98119.1 transporter substrate-binding domain-containing protein [Gordonia araii NBRC 100433]GAB08508.1 putative ABC transporter substrate binding protein [Gordonia araii NBRC 100433]
MRTRVRAALVLVALTATGCVRFTAPDSPPPLTTANTPTPPGMVTQRPGAPTSPESDTDNCNRLASLRPIPLPPRGQMPPRTPMAEIAASGRLIVGIDTGSNPFSFRDPLSGDLRGFDVDIAREISRAIFDDPNRIEFRVMRSADRVDALRNREVDLVVKTMSITCERRRHVDFSSPYYVAAQRILAVNSSKISQAEDLAGKRVCVATGATSALRLRQIVPTATLVETSTWADCLVLLQQSGVDAVSTDDAILAGLAAQDPWLQLVGPSLGEEYYGIGIAKGRDGLVRFVNAVLVDLMASGRWRAIADEWLSMLGSTAALPRPTYRD